MYCNGARGLLSVSIGSEGLVLQNEGNVFNICPISRQEEY